MAGTMWLRWVLAGRFLGALLGVTAILAGCGLDPVGGGDPSGSGGTAGGAGGTGGAIAGAVCTSMMTWTRGNHGDETMNPGLACITCHSADEGPKLTIAGTLYPTLREPDLCDGADGKNGAKVVITGNDGATVTLTPNSAGNFVYAGKVATPFHAKVTYMGREMVMATAQTTGDCNSCHTQAGAMSAPGRIILP